MYTRENRRQRTEYGMLWSAHQFTQVTPDIATQESISGNRVEKSHSQPHLHTGEAWPW